MKLKYIDAHAHLNFDSYDTDRAEILRNLKNDQAGAVNVGIDIATSTESIELAKENEHIWATVGCHPTEVDEKFSADLYDGLIIKDAAEVVAVGECGLDYFRSANRDDANQKLQLRAFEDQIELALTHDLPLILHLRPREGSMDAYKTGLDVLEHYSKQYGDKLRGTAHFFVGDESIARRFMDIGFYVSATGVVTFDTDLQNIFADIPTDHLLVETDAPFAAPEPHRGQRNSPLYVPDIVKKLAVIKKVPEHELSERLVSNTQRLFSL
jgi:TatD DNase family protein